MKFLLLCFVLLWVGCSKLDDGSAGSQGEYAKSAEVDPENKILKSLKSTNRNSIHVALWTLKTNGIEPKAEIDFDSPYKDVSQELDSLCVRLLKMDPAQLSKLNQSLEHHRQIYSPIWGPNSENWH